MVIAEHYPLPRIDDMLSNLGGAKKISTLDLRSAFHQIELSEESQELTAFSVNFRKYHFRKCHLGIVTAPASSNLLCVKHYRNYWVLCVSFLLTTY